MGDSNTVTAACLGRAGAEAPITAGQFAYLRIDPGTGGLITASAGPAAGAVSAYDSGGDVASLTVAVVAATLHSVFGSIDPAVVGNRFIHLFNAIALPVNGTVPNFAPIQVGAGEEFSIVFPQGRPFATGIVITLSTTRETLTIAAADMWISGEFAT